MKCIIIEFVESYVLYNVVTLKKAHVLSHMRFYNTSMQSNLDCAQNECNHLYMTSFAELLNSLPHLQ